MNTKKFLQAMNDVDKKYIKEADVFSPEPLVESTRGRMWYRAVGMAACAVLICGIVIFGGKALVQTPMGSNAATDGAETIAADDAAYGYSSTSSDSSYTSEEYEIDMASATNPSDIHDLCNIAQVAAEDFWTEKLSAAEIHIDLNEIFATHKSLADSDETYEYDGIFLRTRNIPDPAAVDSNSAEDVLEEYFLTLEREGNDWIVTDVQTELTDVVVPDSWEGVEWVVSRNDDGTVSVSDTYDMDNGFVRYITRTVKNNFELNVVYDENGEILNGLLNVAADSAKNYLGDLCHSSADLAALFLNRVEITQLGKDDYDRMIAKFYFDVRMNSDKEYIGDNNDEVTLQSDAAGDWYTVERTVKIYKEDGEWKCVGANDLVDTDTNYYTTNLVTHVNADFTPEISGSAEIAMPAVTENAYVDFEGEE